MLALAGPCRVQVTRLVRGGSQSVGFEAVPLAQAQSSSQNGRSLQLAQMERELRQENGAGAKAERASLLVYPTAQQRTQEMSGAVRAWPSPASWPTRFESLLWQARRCGTGRCLMPAQAPVFQGAGQQHRAAWRAFSSCAGSQSDAGSALWVRPVGEMR